MWEGRSRSPPASVPAHPSFLIYCSPANGIWLDLFLLGTFHPAPSLQPPRLYMCELTLFPLHTLPAPIPSQPGHVRTNAWASVALRLDLAGALAAGHAFGLSTNGVRGGGWKASQMAVKCLLSIYLHACLFERMCVGPLGVDGHCPMHYCMRLPPSQPPQPPHPPLC